MDDVTISMMDQMIVESRIRDLAHYALGDRTQRIVRITEIISKLSPSWYLVGLGPHFSEIVRVGEIPITFGRPASLLEESSSEVIDYSINDATLMGPREVSRVHMSARFNPAADAIEIRDEESSTGVWLGQESNAMLTGHWQEIESGSLISLGPSRTNTLVCLCISG